MKKAYSQLNRKHLIWQKAFFKNKAFSQLNINPLMWQEAFFMKKASSQLNRKPLIWQEAFFMKKFSSQLNRKPLVWQKAFFMKKASSQLNRKPLICNFVHKKAKVSFLLKDLTFPRSGLMKSRLPLGNTRIYDLARGLIYLRLNFNSGESFTKQRLQH